MKGFPPVSAMCLTYGRPHLLEEAIQSFLLQDYPGPTELVVVNDFADQTLICDHINVRIINTGERFATVGEKRNACAELASHDILFVWDDDDIHLPWRISLSIQRLDESKGFYKSPRAWMISDGQLQGPATNLYHSAACFTRELFERAGRYPHIGSGQDWGLEEEFKKLIPEGKDDFSLTLDQLYYIYRWRGTGSYHLSAFGRDEGKVIKGSQRVAEFVNSQVAAGKIRTGMVRLKPAWRADYVALVETRISDPSGAPVAFGNTLQQQPLIETETIEEDDLAGHDSKPVGVPNVKQSVTVSQSNGSPSNKGISATGAWNVPLQKWHQHDSGLANALAEFFRGSSVIDFGCGPGLYVERINETATCRGYDGNPHAAQVKNCQVLDLSKRVDIPPSDWVLSLEVGEHLPRHFEFAFIDNLHRHNRYGIVLSWATPGQGGIGHCNERPIDYIAQCIENLGYERDRAQENVFRNASTKRYFRKNILVLRRASESLTQRAGQAVSGTTGAESLPLISCVMPTYGRPEFVHESLAMFLAQDYENKELLIVNDCPGQEFQCDLPQVRIINCDQRYQSLGEKRNFAISQAQGDWLAVWDDDDIYLPWRLSFSMQEIVEFETPLYRPLTYWAYWGQQQLHENQATPGWISHPLMIFHRELWQKSGGYPHITLSEDSGLFQKMHKLLGTGWLTYPIAKWDRFMIMRCSSMYNHTSIAGGRRPPNTTPGTIQLSPQQIQDDLLRQSADSLIARRSKSQPAEPIAVPPTCQVFGKGWFESIRTRSYVDDLPIESKSVGFGALGRHGRLGYAGKKVVVEGRYVRHALSAHAPATLKFRLDGKYSEFETHVAINDDAIGKATSADFFVLVDGEVKGCATAVIPGDVPRRIAVCVENAQTVELQTRTSRWDHCHTVWIEPTLRLGGSNGKSQPKITDCLKRAEVTLPDFPQQEVELCIATVASPGYEDWLQTFLASLKVNGGCKEALIAVFCLGTNSKIDHLIQQYGAIRVDCDKLANVNMASKSILYSVGKIVPAKKYLCFDTDMLLLGSLQGVVSSLDIFPKSSVLICRDAANIPTLGHALTGLYGSNQESLKNLAGESAVGHLDCPLVVNDGFFAATRPAINAVDELIRSFPGAVEWISEKSAVIPWRNQFVFNLALAKLGVAVEIDPSMNWQLNQRHLDFDESTGTIRTTSQGNPIKVIHFNGGGRNKYPKLREQYRHGSNAVASPRISVTDATKPGKRSNRTKSSRLRFVICSTLRTGSHMLATALNQHPDLEVAGEILVRPKLFEIGNGRRLPDDEAAVIDEAYEKFNGCIIHRQHVRAMEHLGKLPDLRVLFLTRQNWLAQLASEIRAHRTNVWHFVPEGVNYLSNDGTSKPTQPQTQLTISLDRCFQFLREQNRLELLALEHLSRRPLLVVAYEELQWKWEATIKEVLRFLELADAPLTPTTLKQGPPARHAVTNYDEICQLFANTRWDLSLEEQVDGEQR